MIVDPKWGNPPLPIDSFRPGQEELVYEIYERFEAGAKVVFLQAPTGIGKSVIGESVRRLIGGNGVYACSTKALQDQFVTDFTYGQVLKGRTNYLTLSGPLDRFGRKSKGTPSMVTCADCTYTQDAGCRWCPSRTGCPYIKARTRAEVADLAILNTSYLLTDANKGRGRFRNRDLCVLDEADLLENEILNQAEVFISKRRMSKMNILPPPRKTVESTWPGWIENEAIPKIRRYLEHIPRPHEHNAGVMDLKEYASLIELLDKLRLLADDLRKGGWVYDGYAQDNVIFRPIEINDLGQRMVWPHSKRFLLMSATILSADKMSEQLGVTDTWDFIDVPDSPFPIEHRPIFIVPVADMAFRLKNEEWPKMIEGVKGVLNRHPDERILVHCVSYELANYLYSACRRDRFCLTYTNSSQRDQILIEYKNNPGAVIFAASMDRGIDLPGDLCRVQVITKIPFGNLKDKRVNARMRMRGGNTWYKMNAIRTMVQMTGRGVRSEDDYATTYILDKQFISNIMSSKYLLPQWWSKAMKMDLSPRKLMSNVR